MAAGRCRGVHIIKLWRLWRDSDRERDRPPSYVFVMHRDPVRDDVLEHWGLTVIAGEKDDPEALAHFLEGLRKAAFGEEDGAGR